jgi:CubicO group peptidase (beta-lactamase class C family)
MKPIHQYLLPALIFLWLGMSYPLHAQDRLGQLENLPGPTDPTRLDQFILEGMKEARVPGLAATVVKDGKILWTGSYGWANVGDKKPVDEKTLFQLASIAKTVTATVVMQLVEQDRISLDADINDLLPFPIRNPRHPDVAITLRQLLTHTSSLRDNWSVLEGTWVQNRDFPHSLAESMARYFQPRGAYYSRGRNFYEWAPGTNSRYSNIAFALVAFIAQSQAGVPFEQLCKEGIFDPLGMEGCGYRLSKVDQGQVAIPYIWRARAGQFRSLGHHGYLDFPSGTLRTSAPQLARFLLSFIGDGQVDEARILKEQTIQLMRRTAFPRVAPGQGLAWYRDRVGGSRVMGHDGSDPGVTTMMCFRPADGVGVVVLMNAEPENRHFEGDVCKRLFKYAGATP